MNYYAMVDVSLQRKENQETDKGWNKEVRSKQIINNICYYYSINPEDLRSRNRKAAVRDARNLTMYCLHKVLKLTSTYVGEMLNRDHATVLNGSKRTMDWIETDKKYEQLVATILNK